MFFAKVIAGLLLFFAFGEFFPKFVIANANGDPLLALERVMQGLILGLGIYAFLSHMSAKQQDKERVKTLQYFNDRLKLHEKQIKKLQGQEA